MTPIQRMAVEIKQYIFFAYMNSKRIIWLLSFVGLALLTDARDYKYKRPDADTNLHSGKWLACLYLR